MLSLLKIKNIALIERLEVEFGPGLNLLTGETGSGKSIIVDSLGALTGDRVTSDLIREGQQSAQIEGIFAVNETAYLKPIFDESGIDLDDNGEIIVRRELSLAGRNRIFVNDQLITHALLKRIGPALADIHGQGEQASLYDVETHAVMLDEYAGVDGLLAAVDGAHSEWSRISAELAAFEQDEAEKLQLLDILRFQADEIRRVGPQAGEDAELEVEKSRLNNAEKLSALSDEAYALLYESDTSTASTLEKAARRIAELAEFDGSFHEFDEGLITARAVIEELARAARDFRSKLEFSPDRLNEIENRLAELSRLTRKYGGSIETVLAHLVEAERRLENIEMAEFREAELKKQLDACRTKYVEAATKLHEKRVSAANRFEKAVVAELKDVALEKARFDVQIDSPDLSEPGADKRFTSSGFDTVEFYFSANPGESPKPLARVASGGEASRLMLVLKTTVRADGRRKTAVFDEIDIGIGGRVAESVGRKLKQLSETQQVLCVTHQPQIASLADQHLLISKAVAGGRTSIAVRRLDATERVEEIARMLAGEHITEQARENARAMLAAAA